MDVFRLGMLWVGTGLLVLACSDASDQARGDLAKSGGSASVRMPYEAVEDDPLTTNDESNDQPVGHFGTITVLVTSQDSGNTYTLDAELDGTTVERIYFPRGGWVDFYDCEVDEDVQGDCDDEEGRSWTLEGVSTSSATDPFIAEETAEEEEEQQLYEDAQLAAEAQAEEEAETEMD